MAKKTPEPQIDVYKTTDKRNRFSAENKEILNPTPMQPPLGYKAQPSLLETVRQQVLQMKRMEDNEPETEEEADDFEIDDDPQPVSRWENDMVPSIKETRARIRQLEEEERKYAAPPSAKPAEAPPEPEKS
ncbi:hypothetical protein [robinz microvirus RP_165]|nr:hypothetical protein [robinz microvirus RP_165]